MQTDALSDVLRVLNLSGGMFFRVRLRPPYAIIAKDADAMRQAFAPGAEHMLPFHLVTQGPIYFNVRGVGVERLETGDVIVLPHGAGHALANPPDRQPVPVSEFKDRVSGSPPTLIMEGDGEEARALCGFFHCRGRLFNPLMEALPQVVVIRRDPSRTPWLEATLERTFDETLGNRPGGAAMVERLTGLLFMEVVQRHLEQDDRGGWLGGLADPIIGKTLKLIHDQPARAWTVEELARRSGASRSRLADRFVELVGMSPFKYLTAWRMELAAARLLETDDGMAEIASDVGYESEASFSRAFKRLVGEAPSHWRSARTA